MMKVILFSAFLPLVNGWMSASMSLIVLLVLLALLSKHDLDWFELSLNLGWDAMSLGLILLSVWILILMVLSSEKVFSSESASVPYLVVMMLLLITLIASFSSSSLLMFYIFFEASLIPTLALILGWGYQPERLQAGVYMMMYTIFASLPLLLVLLIFYLDDSSTSPLLSFPISSNSSVFLLLGASMAFMVKLPIYLVHLWLPKAHVEAPVAGSMILASVLLKLGGYGLIRLSSKVSSSMLSSSWLLMSWGMVGGVFISVVCIRQVDIKVLIALSSVAHMSMVFGGILTMTSWGVNGALLVMMGHGFCSSGLFCIANMAYERSGTRSLQIMKGAQAILPSLSLWWFLLVAANMAAPPSMNLLGEIHAIIGSLHWSMFMSFPIAGLTFFAAAYSLYLYSNTQHGKSPLTLFSAKSPSLREHAVMISHWLPINFLVVKFSMLQLMI